MQMTNDRTVANSRILNGIQLHIIPLGYGIIIGGQTASMSREMTLAVLTAGSRTPKIPSVYSGTAVASPTPELRLPIPIARWHIRCTARGARCERIGPAADQRRRHEGKASCRHGTRRERFNKQSHPAGRLSRFPNGNCMHDLILADARRSERRRRQPRAQRSGL